MAEQNDTHTKTAQEQKQEIEHTVQQALANLSHVKPYLHLDEEGKGNPSVESENTATTKE